MRKLINLALPLKCRICRNILSYDNSTEICDKCWKDVKIFPPTGCLKCDNTIRLEEQKEIMEESFCFQCREHSKNINRLASFGIYEGSLKEAIHLFKYGRNLYTGERLANYAIEVFNKVYLPQDFDFIIPVPLHKSRLRWKNSTNRLFLQVLSAENSIYRFVLIFSKGREKQNPKQS